MSIFSPKVQRPNVPPVARQPDEGVPAEPDTAAAAGYSSLIATGPAGLKRKASTVKSSLIGGGSAT